jgi:hypothetical protein
MHASARERTSHASGVGEVSPEPARPIVRVEADGAKPPGKK